jgi:thymidylate synthase (FAD)
MKAEYIDHMGNDLTVANAARVSMGKWKAELDDADVKLIGYLARHNHWTPFGQPAIQLRITVPIFVARQAHRSTVGTVRNEESRRYVDDDPEFFVPVVWRSRPEKSIKQGSGGPLPTHLSWKADAIYGGAIDHCEQTYKNLLALGVAPEQARMVLPQSMMTSWIETGTLAYWWRFYGLRSDSHAQKEIQELAAMIKAVVEPLFPVCWAALESAGQSKYETTT